MRNTIKHDKVIPVEELVKQDKASIGFTSMILNGIRRNAYTTNYIRERLLKFSVSGYVPEEVKKHIETAKIMCIRLF